AAQLRREAVGLVTPRAAIENEDTGNALEVLRTAVDVELAPDVRRLAVYAVLAQWRSDGRGPGAHSEAAGMAHRFAAELLETRFVTDATFAAALDALGERGVVNLMVLMGYSNIRCAQQALAGAVCVL
ncbi:MAG TPA: hypothetical protein VIZ30_02240, partial [Pseudomonadales bacterium]